MFGFVVGVGIGFVAGGMFGVIVMAVLGAQKDDKPYYGNCEECFGCLGCSKRD